ncbi:MmgE/PrpD family protein [Spirochaetota bacterium]
MKKLSSVYADFIFETNFDKLPPEVVTKSKSRLLDTIGVSLGGYKMMEFPQIVVEFVLEMGGAPEATVIQTKKKVPAINAALANGACAHALDMDDGHRFSALHPAVAVIPAALAAAEMSNATTKDLITGIVVGYEIMIRIGMAINPSSLQRGFHSTGVAGAFGATAAAANIMKLGHDEIVGALGMAGLQASGLLAVNHDDVGAKVKPINPGKAAVSGLLSCILARKGARGPIQIFEGEDGFLSAITDEVKDDLLISGLGEKFETLNTYDKLYAACRHTHAAMDAALEISEKNQIKPENIQKISVETYPAAIKLAGIEEPSTASAARFSIAFSLAMLLILKDASADKYSEETVSNRNIQNLSKKVTLSNGKKWEKAYPNQRGATVTIIDNDNKEYTLEVELAKGEPENPASSEELYKKYLVNATMQVSKEEAEKLGKVILDLENRSLSEFTELI